MTAHPSPRDEPIALPAPPPAARRGSIPVVAAFVPVVGAVAMWLLTGHILMLCFAAIGPLMALASVVDGARGRRRERRQAAREIAAACVTARDELRARHDAEREDADRRHPDVAQLARARTLWRHGATELVLGRGRVPSEARVTGGEGEEAENLRRDALWVVDAPVAVSLDEIGGVCVQGDAPLADAVVRGFVAQLALRASPRELVMAELPAGDAEAFAELPHARPAATGAAAGGALRIAVRDLRAGSAPASGGAPEPHGEADIVIALADRGAAAPPGCGVVMELDDDGGLLARMAGEAEADTLSVEALARPQAAALARELRRRAGGEEERRPPAATDLRGLLGETQGEGTRDALCAVLGAGVAGPAEVDLVADGPHAVVIGMTGSGKSELLITWITALAAGHSPRRVSFLLADFKGGTAFTPLLSLPHVTGLITDLDGAGSRRAVESLRAELRRRETALAAAGARDVADERVDLPRLVIVVDEFAALLQDHADLNEVFTDVAARGRALGMHLVLGTQRAAGVVREALLANCPLRISLRVAEAADSRAVIGTDEAAALPGDAAGRGLALVRRGRDAAPWLTRIARADATLIEAIAGRRAAQPEEVPKPPWLPPLPERLGLAELRGRGGSQPERALLLGLADEPEEQRQGVVSLIPGHDRGLAIVGGSGSGKSSAATLLAAQHRDALVVPRDAEAAWDAIAAAAIQPPELLVLDDLDALAARYPPEHAQELWERVEAIVRDAGETRTTVVITAARAGGACARVMDLLPRRALLRLGSRAEHVQAGGDGSTYDPRRVPGRAVLDGRETQFALMDGVPSDVPAERPGGGASSGRRRRRDSGREGAPPAGRPWRPTTPAALVAAGAAARARALTGAWGDTVRVVSLDTLRPGTTPDGWDAGEDTDVPLLVVGEADAWLRHGALLAELRARGELLIAAECPSELRTLAGERSLPPYARIRAGRAWLIADGGPRRVVLPA